MRDAAARVSRAPLREGNALDLLSTGPDTLEEWLARIRSAERWVHLENYIFWADEVGERFAEALRERASAGVCVRVLVDWFGSMTVPRGFWNSLREAGVEVRMVNPPAPGAPLAATNRDHRKVLAVDGEYASVGGVCICDGWDKRSPETGLPYRDTAVGVRGPAVADLEHAFAGMWAMAGGPLPEGERLGAGGIPEAGERAVRVIPQQPGKMRIHKIMELLTRAAGERLWINDPFFLSTPLLDLSLMDAARDGVDVRVTVPATNDHPVIGMLMRARYRRLLDSGVLIYEHDAPMMHAKTSVADGRLSRVGSTNLNPASLLTCWELDLLVEDTGFGARMEELFEQDVANSREVRLAHPAPGATAESEGTNGDARQGVSPEDEPGPSAILPARKVGGTVLWKGGVRVRAHERAIPAAACAAVLGASLVGVRFPRLIAWPLAAAGVALGGPGLLSVARRMWRDCRGTGNVPGHPPEQGSEERRMRERRG